MPVRPDPLEFYCPLCGWKFLWQPASDALTQPSPKECPKCGCSNLESRPVSSASTLWGALGQWFMRQ